MAQQLPYATGATKRKERKKKCINEIILWNGEKMLLSRTGTMGLLNGTANGPSCGDRLDFESSARQWQGLPITEPN